MLCCSSHFKVSIFYIIFHRWILFYFIFIIIIIFIVLWIRRLWSIGITFFATFEKVRPGAERKIRNITLKNLVEIIKPFIYLYIYMCICIYTRILYAWRNPSSWRTYSCYWEPCTATPVPRTLLLLFLQKVAQGRTREMNLIRGTARGFPDSVLGYRVWQSKAGFRILNNITFCLLFTFIFFFLVNLFNWRKFIEII